MSWLEQLSLFTKWPPVGMSKLKNCSKWLLREEQVLQISKNGSKSPNRPYRGGMQFVQPLSLTFMTGFGWNIAVCKWCRVLVRMTPTASCIFVTWMSDINQNNSKGGKTMMIIVSSLLPCNQDFTSSLLHKIWAIIFWNELQDGRGMCHFRTNVSIIFFFFPFHFPVF